MKSNPAWQLSVELHLDSTKKRPVQEVYRPIGFLQKGKITLGHELIFMVGQAPLMPGEHRWMKCELLHEGSFLALKAAGKFYI
jgi:hypothetical protein